MVSDATIAIIPARGGSKRIPRKNIIDFHGKPMIAWTIEAALRSGCFDRVVVSTDDAEIAEVARTHGAEVPFLRGRHADDIAPVSLATLEALSQTEEILGERYARVVQLMANCPLRNEADITAALENFSAQDSSSQISCFRFGWMNPWWAVTLDEANHPQMLFPDAYKTGSQNLPPLFCPSGAIWVANVAHLREHGSFHTPTKTFLPMAWQSAMDIDDYEDLEMAKVLMTSWRATGC